MNSIKPRGFNVIVERNASQIQAIADDCLQQVDLNADWQEQEGKEPPGTRMRKLVWHCLKGRTSNPEVGQEQA